MCVYFSQAQLNHDMDSPNEGEECKQCCNLLDSSGDCEDCERTHCPTCGEELWNVGDTECDECGWGVEDDE